MSGHISDNNHLEEENGYGKLTTNGISEGPYLMGKVVERSEQLLKSLGPSTYLLVYLILKMMMNSRYLVLSKKELECSA